MRYVGDGFAVDAAAYEVERDGEPVELEPQAMDLLLYMVERRGQLLTKAELLDNVWGDQFVGDAALATRIKQVRAALGDDGRSQRVIQTVHGRGYKFIGELTPAATDTAAAPLDVTPPPERHNIPPPRTEMVGRVELLDEVADSLAASRLVNLVGLGGAGKTTTAQTVGRRVVDRFEHGVWFVDLIPVRDRAGAVRALASGLGFQLGPDSGTAELIAWLGRRQLCIVLDNCEHVIDDAAALCSDVLDGAPEVRILATSREPLRVVGEHRISVGPLPIADESGGAVELLEAVARRAGAEVTAADRAHALELCARVDGLPLAIEIVGARLATFSLADIVERLDRLESSVGPRRPDRHASLGVVLRETLAALDDEAVRLLTLLVRLTGGFDLDDVEALGSQAGVAAPLDRLGELVDRSLIVPTSGPPRRFGVLETVRQHVGANDPDPDATSTTHAAWCLDLVGESVADHYHDLTHADRISRRYDDLLDARAHLASLGRETDAAHLVAASGLAMHLDDGSRAATMLGLLQRHAGRADDPALRARLHCSGVMAAMAAREHAAMYQHGLDAVTAAAETSDATLQSLALVMRSWAGVVIDVDAALVDLDEAVRLAESVGDLDTAMMATGYKALNLAMALRFEEATAIADAAIARDMGRASYPRRVVVTGLISCLLVDDPRRALELDTRVREGVGLSSFWGTAIIRAACQAQLREVDTVNDSLRQLEDRLDRAGISPLPDILLVPASLANALGDEDRAALYLGAVRAASEPTQSLMVSTAYRVLRSHVPPLPPDQIDGSTAEIWADAKAWMATHN